MPCRLQNTYRRRPWSSSGLTSLNWWSGEIVCGSRPPSIGEANRDGVYPFQYRCRIIRTATERCIMKSEHAERAAQHEADHRWADDGGFIPEMETRVAPVVTRSPWRAVGIAAAVGFALGWLTSPRGGR